MKKITIIGGCGVIGRLLTKALSAEYSVTIIDLTSCVEGVILADAANEQNVYEAIPRDTDVILHLLNMHMTHDVMDHEEFAKMTDIFGGVPIICFVQPRGLAYEKSFLQAATM